MTQAEIIHVFNPSETAAAKVKVHAVLWNSARIALCGQARIFKEHDGEWYRIFQPTSRPITCRGCIKVIEVIIRNEMTKLNPDDGTDLEEIFRLVLKLRGGDISAEEHSASENRLLRQLKARHAGQ